MTIAVEDPSDERLADYRRLKDPARASLESARAVFVAEGRLAVERLLDSPYEVLSLLVDDHQARGAAALVGRVLAAGAPVYVATRETLEQTVGFALHRGVVALGRRPAPLDPAALVSSALSSAREREVPAVLAVLEGLNDHENLGALFRNAAAFSVDAVLLDPSCADPLYRRSVRVSLGHVLGVPFARLGSFPSGLTEVLAGTGTVLAALTPARGAGRRVGPCGQRPAVEATGPIDVAELAERHRGATAIALLLGAEGPGLSPGAIGAAGEVASVPMAPGVDSLNVATAAALAFYEIDRRRRSRGDLRP